MRLPQRSYKRPLMRRPTATAAARLLILLMLLPAAGHAQAVSAVDFADLNRYQQDNARIGAAQR